MSVPLDHARERGEFAAERAVLFWYSGHRRLLSYFGLIAARALSAAMQRAMAGLVL